MNQQNAKNGAKEGLWKLTPLMEIRRQRGFPPRLEKAAHYAGLFHSSHKPDGAGSIYLNKLAARLRSIFYNSRRAD